MSSLKFEVCQTGSGHGWVVLANGKLYGRYLSREAALLDAREAAEDSRLAGREAEVVDTAVL